MLRYSSPVEAMTFPVGVMSRKLSQLVRTAIRLPHRQLITRERRICLVFIGLLEVKVQTKDKTLSDGLSKGIAHRLRIEVVVIVAGYDEEVASLEGNRG